MLYIIMSKVQQYWGQAVTASLDRPLALDFSSSLSISIILAWDFHIFLENENKEMKSKIQTKIKRGRDQARELVPWDPSVSWCCALLPVSPHPSPLPSAPRTRTSTHHQRCGARGVLLGWSMRLWIKQEETWWTSLSGSLSFLQSHWFLQ